MSNPNNAWPISELEAVKEQLLAAQERTEQAIRERDRLEGAMRRIADGEVGKDGTPGRIAAFAQKVLATQGESDA